MRKILFTIFLSLTASYSAQVKYESLFKTDRHDLTENVFVMVRPDWVRMFVVGNISVIKTNEGLIVFDGGNNSEVALNAIKEIKKDTDLPVKYLVISHGHIDHTGGISEFKREWPAMEIIGHNTLYPYMKRNVDRVKNFAKTNFERWNKRDSLISEVEREYKDSKPLQEYFRQYYLKDVLALAKHYEKTTISLPAITFEDSLNIYLGGKQFKIFKAGNAHTPSDILIYIPDEKILLTGDVVTRPVPYGFTKDGEEWIEVIDKLLNLEINWVVPGHGEPLNGKEYLHKLRGVFTAVIEHIEKGIKEEKPQEEIRETISVDDFRKYFTEGDPVINNRFDVWFLDPFITRNYERIIND